MFHALQHLEFVIYHLLVSLHILLEDDLYCNLSIRAICLPNNTIRPSSEGTTEAIFRPN